jgi:hypothetical protein
VYGHIDVVDLACCQGCPPIGVPVIPFDLSSTLPIIDSWYLSTGFLGGAVFLMCPSTWYLTPYLKWTLWDFPLPPLTIPIGTKPISISYLKCHGQVSARIVPASSYHCIGLGEIWVGCLRKGCYTQSCPWPNSTPFPVCCALDFLTPDRILGRRSPLRKANESFLPVTQTVVNHTPLSSSRERLPLESFPSETEILSRRIAAKRADYPFGSYC